MSIGAGQIAGTAFDYVKQDSTGSGELQDRNLLRGLRFDRGTDWWKDSVSGFGILGDSFGGDDEDDISFLEMLAQLPQAAQIGMDTTNQIAPQQAQLQLDLLQQYGLPTAQTQQDAFAQLYPDTASLPEYLAGRAIEGSQEGLTSNEQRILTDAIRANLGDQAVSGLGTQRLGADLMNATLARQSQFLNLGQNLSSRVPLYEAQIPQYTDYASMVTPGLVTTGQLGIDQLVANQYAGTSGANSGIGNLLGSLLGGQSGSSGSSVFANLFGNRNAQSSVGLNTNIINDNTGNIVNGQYQVSPLSSSNLNYGSLGYV